MGFGPKMWSFLCISFNSPWHQQSIQLEFWHTVCSYLRWFWIEVTKIDDVKSFLSFLQSHEMMSEIYHLGSQLVYSKDLACGTNCLHFHARYLFCKLIQPHDFKFKFHLACTLSRFALISQTNKICMLCSNQNLYSIWKCLKCLTKTFTVKRSLYVVQ